VAARGIDLPDLDLVIHADMPKNTEGLLHRSGRTGRAGRKGASVLIFPFSARRRAERLFQAAGVTARWGEPPGADAIKRRDDERLLGDPSLLAGPKPEEMDIVRALLEQHDPAHIAAAFVRLARQGQAPPEDLAPNTEWTDKPTVRERRGDGGGENFVGGSWASLSVGRAQSAEPRWLIPMLCKAGGLTKRQLGAIRIHQHETHVEIDAGAIDAFFHRLGEGGRLEKSIHVTRLLEAPNAVPRGKPTSPNRAQPGNPTPARANGRVKPKKSKTAKKTWHPAD
jgi:ATP-dependent RNA helicase DeaD